MHRFCCRSPAVRGQVRSYENRDIADKGSVAPSAHATRFCPKGVGADLSAMGCEADPKPATLVVSDAPRRLVLLPVPGSSRTSPLRKPGYRGQVKRRPVFLQSPAGWQRVTSTR
ncbi:hypothetical protein CUB86_01385 [Pseudomonas syringae pv. actinidiae]|uniref:Uncharacterized protein n=1 Tax=Pseudomonas syringae pv. actinidiae TaxID=103796 RepID=A0AAU8XDL7_PSESF|nr:hypothetical protein CT122_07900 [Pseudomonas syringae pv. actinidiae]PIN63213.1 hypothetical protein CUB86_01385 [Pseudomonas syringae pv. actinidiae]